MRSGNSIGANIREAQFGVSKAEFIHKMKIALREANETQHWITILHRTDKIDTAGAESLNKDIEDIIHMLVAIIRTSEQKFKSK